MSQSGRVSCLVPLLVLSLLGIALSGCVQVELVMPTSPSAPVAPTAGAPATAVPVTPAAKAVWTVMLYLDADDPVLEQDIYYDLNEAERVGSTAQVNIVAQMDRYQGGFQGQTGWTSCKRLFVTKDSDLERVASRQLADLGEVNMADGNTLADFAVWAMKQFPAEKYALILSDHGAGWPGGYTDATAPRSYQSDAPLSSTVGDLIYLMELGDALKKVQSATGVQKLDLIGFDACLMSQIEVLHAVSPYAKYAVSSEEVEPSLGWAYSSFLQKIATRPELSGQQLATAIVESYINEDTQILDDQARAQFLLRAYNTTQRLSAEQVAREVNKSVTLSAVDLSALPNVVRSLDSLLTELTQVQQKGVARSRAYAQSFENVFGESATQSRPYIDLGHWALLLKEELRTAKVSAAVDQLLTTIDRAVIANKAGSQKSGASGLAIYFPTSGLYRSDMAGIGTYTSVARAFAAGSLWDDYLQFHYTGKPMQAAGPAGPTPQPGGGGPGAEKVSIAPISLSSTTTSMSRPVTLKTEIRGDRIGYLYLFVARVDETSRAIVVTDMDYLEADAFKEIDGVTYPDWGDDAVIPITFKWEPTVFALTDGTTTEIALFAPQAYAAAIENLTYASDGIYTLAGEGQQVYSRLLFDGDGILRRILVYQGQTATGPVRTLLPQQGDQFTILEQRFKPAADGGLKIELQAADTVTFRNQNLRWKEVQAPAGRYTLGMFVTDLDGNMYQQYAEVSVE